MIAQTQPDLPELFNHLVDCFRGFVPLPLYVVVLVLVNFRAGQWRIVEVFSFHVRKHIPETPSQYGSLVAVWFR